MAYKDPEMKRQKRRERYERELERMASDPVFAAERRKKQLAAEERYREKQRLLPKAPRPIVDRRPPMFKERKPGRIVALCGWMRW